MKITTAIQEPSPPAPPAHVFEPRLNELDVPFRAVSVAQALHGLNPAHDFSVIRDPGTGVVLMAIRRATGELIDLCSPEALFDNLDHLPCTWKETRE
jgi:hypothetical protein